MYSDFVIYLKMILVGVICSMIFIEHAGYILVTFIIAILVSILFEV